MSAESELYAALAARAGLTALVSTRIYPDAIPEDSDLPAVVYQRANTSPITTIGGVVIVEEVRFAISAWAKTRTSADAIADEIAPALATAGNPYADRSTGYDPEVGLHAVTVEVEWWHTP